MLRQSSFAAFRLRRLVVLGQDLLQAPSMRAVLERVGLALSELTDANETLLLVNLHGEEYVGGFARDDGLLEPVQAGSALSELARQALRAEKPMVQRGVAHEAQASTLLAVPFPDASPIGVLALHWNGQLREHRLIQHTSTLRQIGGLTAAALHNVAIRMGLEEDLAGSRDELEEALNRHAEEIRRRDRVEEEMRRVALKDPLTGALNRRGFFLYAELGIRIARRQKMQSAIVFADIDDLKGVNDELGHDVGDHLLQAAARIFMDTFRDSDVVARLGGDEFAAFTLGSEDPDAIIARIRENSEEFHRRFSTPYRVSFSTGIVNIDPEAELGVADYLARADREMYARKRTRSANPPATT
jgi:diguanylate cyclase (GGDEF)-like protein